MELEFDRTPEDLIAFNLYHIAHSASARSELLTQRLLISVFAAWFAGGSYLLTPRYFNWVVLGAAATAGLVVFVLYPVFARRSTIGRLRKLLNEGNNETLFGRQSVVISPDSLLASNLFSDSKTKWTAVQAVAEAKEHFFLFTSSMHAILIPKSCFGSEEDQREFVRLVEEYRTAR